MSRHVAHSVRSGQEMTFDSEVMGVSAPKPADQPPDHFAMRNGIRCAGVLLIVDVYNASNLDNIAHIETMIRASVEAARATIEKMNLKKFGDGGGVSGTAILSESHISIHTWPECMFAAIDIFMCGDTDPDACLPIIRKALHVHASDMVVKEELRGQRFA